MARPADADRRHADAYRLTERPAPAPADPGEASPPRVVDNAAQAARAARARSGAAPIVREPKQFAAAPGPLAPPPTADGVPPPPAPPPFDDE